MLAEILLASIAEPDAQDLRDLLFLGFREALIQFERPLAFHTAGTVFVGIPVSPCETNATGGLFHERGAG